MSEYIDRETTKVFLRDNGVCDDITDLINYVPAAKDIERVLDAYGRCMTLRSESSNRLSIIREILTSRLQEIAQSEKDGRLEVLPCKIGDTVYMIPTFGVFEQNIINGYKRLNQVYKHYVESITILGKNEYILDIQLDYQSLHSKYLGERWFLERKQAEDALSAMQKKVDEKICGERK